MNFNSLLFKQLHIMNWIKKSTYAFLIAALSATGCSDSGEKAPGSGDSTGTASGQQDELFTRYQLDKIKLPPGFSISVYAEVPNARSMCWGDNGTLFVGNRNADKVYAVVDNDQDGKADTVYVIDSDLQTPNGVAFRDGSLYVAEISRILRYDSIESRLNNPPKPKVVYDKYPTDAHHGWKFIAFGPDGKLYVPVGAPCNICDRKEPVYASITRMNPDGTGMEIYAKGVRNSVGFAWHPDTKELWFTDNGRDQLGDDIPNDELNHAPQAGMHFGYPYIHQGDTPDPEFGKGKNAGDYAAPAQLLGPHVAALGMRFYTGNMFHAEYKNRIIIAQHGSWNRSQPIGYRVMMATLEGNKVVKYEPFAEGWLQPNNDVLGRPVDVEIMKDGSLLISDDKNGAIYRVVYDGNK
jgi:glucose/arabinose dehydrogenase